MKFLFKTTWLLFTISILISCSEDEPTTDEQTPITEDTRQISNGSPRFTGDINALFVGHSALNDVVGEYVTVLARLKRSETEVSADVVTNYDPDHAHDRFSGLSLGGKVNYDHVRDVFNNDSHDYHFAVITEEWDYQNYNVDYHGTDQNDPVDVCRPSDYAVPGQWSNPEFDWYFNPYYVQLYRDALVCGNASNMVFYYQTWSLGWNEVENGDRRLSDQNYSRPTYDQIRQDIRTGQNFPDLPLADRIDYEGVKWQHFIHHANRPDIVFIPAAFALSQFIRDVEAGVVPGFEAVAATDGMTDDGHLAWRDYLFYQDGYHLASAAHYLMALVIYATVFNESPVGIPIGEGNFRVSWAFSENQYPLTEITNEAYENLLQSTGANGVFDLRGHEGLEYIHEDLRNYLQELAWEVVQRDSNY